MSFDPVIKEHQDWLGLLQPVGLVVSPTALKQAQARVARNAVNEQQILLRHTREVVDEDRGKNAQAAGRGAEHRRNPPVQPRFGGHNLREFPGKRKLNRFTDFAKEFWSWEDADLATPPETLSTALQEYGEILRPDWAVPGVRGESEWQLLIQELPPAQTMDQDHQEADERSWKASPQARFERLLRDTGIPVGLLVSADAIRLIYAPKGETAGHLTFPIHEMCETAGRPMVAALHLLLDAQRLFALPKEQRLPAILQASRKFQNEVSIKLASQVLRALNELCRGFNEANRAAGGALLRQMIAEAPEDIYGGLLTTLMRLVFLLYAEDRSLMASDEIYQRDYGLIGLHEKLREDDAAYQDTMDQRFGAWAQFLTLSRLVHDGGGHGKWRLPARRGRLFDPDSYAFLEGRSNKSRREWHQKLTPPKISDGVLYRVLKDLLFLDGERISYRALDVEQIGSVYEAMMGFTVEVATGPSVGFKPDHVVVNLQTLLKEAAGDRRKWLKENAGWEPSDTAAQSLKEAKSTEAILAALSSRISPLYLDRDRGTLAIAPGDIYLQPTEERRRSGSHYTPRSLTEPIVRTTLDPVHQQLGANPTPEQILNLKVCDPAMGSGAFLVEACRYLGDALVRAWTAHKATPDIPADQDPLLHARRVVAQRCLYGVDKNPFAVDLAKLSLWLATFAKDHPFTFLDHSFRHGDSLVGLSIDQIVDALGDGKPMFRSHAEARLASALAARQSILDAVEMTPYSNLETHFQNAIWAIGDVRDLGDLLVAAFFEEDKPKSRLRRRNELINAYDEGKVDVTSATIHALRSGNPGITPFHWELEYPEVFAGGGFHAIMGNPPFLGGKRISTELGARYRDWLAETFPESNSNSDLVAFFFRRAFDLLNRSGAFGLIATNTIAQGKTRATALKFIRKNGGTIFNARKRERWPGEAAVIVSPIHIAKGWRGGQCFLDDQPVSRISAFLVEKGGDDDPGPLKENSQTAFNGCFLRGMGFTFDDRSDDGHPLSLMNELIERNPKNRERIFPFLGGEEINDDPRQQFRRYAINFGTSTLREAEEWPELVQLLRASVKPERDKLGKEGASAPWWLYWRPRPEMKAAVKNLRRVLVCSQLSKHPSFAFIPATWIASHKLNVFALQDSAAFCVLQSRIHECWARFLGAKMKDDPCYFPEVCFETFPFPPGWKMNEILEGFGEEYYQFRAELMIRNNEGLTKTYNRFHDKWNQQETEIQKLRDLHAQMDRAVLDAYGWSDLEPVHDYFLEFEEPGDDKETAPRKGKEPWRYRWTDDFRDEVLARLLELNHLRAEQERSAATPVQTKQKTTLIRRRKKKDEQTADMYAEEVAAE